MQKWTKICKTDFLQNRNILFFRYFKNSSKSVLQTISIFGCGRVSTWKIICENFIMGRTVTENAVLCYVHTKPDNFFIWIGLRPH